MTIHFSRSLIGAIGLYIAVLVKREAKYVESKSSASYAGVGVMSEGRRAPIGFDWKDSW